MDLTLNAVYFHARTLAYLLAELVHEEQECSFYAMRSSVRSLFHMDRLIGGFRRLLDWPLYRIRCWLRALKLQIQDRERR
jgi:hypothetical protein